MNTENEKAKMLVLTGGKSEKPLNAEKNVVYMEGSVVSELTRRQFANGNKLVTFMMLHAYDFESRNGEKVQIKEFFEVVSWNKVADLVSGCASVGTLVKLRGRLRNMSWVDIQGKKQSKVQIVVTDMVQKAA